MAEGAGNVIMRDTVFPTLLEDDWQEMVSYNGARAFIDVQNEDATNPVRLQFTKNPFALSFDGTDDFVEIDAVAAAGLTDAVKGHFRARILRDTGGVGDDTIISISDASANEYVKLFINASNILKAELRTAAGGVRWALETTAAIPTAEFIEVKLNHTGLRPELFINRNEVPVTRTVITDEADWINDLSNLDVARLGAINTNGAGNADFYLGDIDWVIIKMSTSINENLTLHAEYEIDEGTITVQSATIADGSGNGFTGNLGAAAAAPTWVVRTNGFSMRANSGREFLANDVTPQALWAFADFATPTTLTVTEGDRGNGEIFH